VNECTIIGVSALHKVVSRMSKGSNSHQKFYFPQYALSVECKTVTFWAHATDFFFPATRWPAFTVSMTTHLPETLFLRVILSLHNFRIERTPVRRTHHFIFATLHEGESLRWVWRHGRFKG